MPATTPEVGSEAQEAASQEVLRIRSWRVEVDLSSIMFGQPWHPETREEWLARLEAMIAQALRGY